MFVAIFVVSIVAIIMFHEFGHFATAKLFGMKCERFFLGFGPTLWSVQRGETEYGVKAIPAGGFVKITGMSAYEPIDPADKGRTFYEQAAWKRAIVLAAGSATHFVLAIVLLFSAFVFIGLPVATNTINRVTDGSPAARAGLQPGDQIVMIAGQPTNEFDRVQRIIGESPGQAISIEFLRDGEQLQRTVVVGTQRPDGEPGGFLGVSPSALRQSLPAGQALAETFTGEQSVFRITALTVEGLADVLGPEGLSRWFASVGGTEPRTPDGLISIVGIGQVVNAFGSSGNVFPVLLLLAQVNIVLGLVNLLPLPPLDGGHLAILGVEETVNGVRRLRGKSASWRLDPSVLTPLALAVIMFFSVIFVTALYADITKPVSDLIPVTPE